MSHSSLANFSVDYFPKRQESFSFSKWPAVTTDRVLGFRESKLTNSELIFHYFKYHNFFLTQQIIKKQSHLNTNPSSVYYFGCQWSWLNSEGVFLPRSPSYMFWFRCSLDGRRRPCTTCICQLAASRFTWPSYDKSKREKEGDTSLLDVPPHMAPAPHPTYRSKQVSICQPNRRGWKTG